MNFYDGNDPYGLYGNSKPDVGLYYSQKLYNGVGGGSSKYENSQLFLQLRDPISGRFLRTNPQSGFFREPTLPAPELPPLTGGIARQLNLFNPQYIPSGAKYFVSPNGQIGTSLPVNLPVPVRGNPLFYGQQYLPGIAPPRNVAPAPFALELPPLTGHTAKQLNIFRYLNVETGQLSIPTIGNPNVGKGALFSQKQTLGNPNVGKGAIFAQKQIPGLFNPKESFIPEGGIQGDLFGQNFGYGKYAQNRITPTNRVVLIQKPIAPTLLENQQAAFGEAFSRIGKVSKLLTGVGALGAAFADPKFNENVLIPSVVGGVSSRIAQDFAVTPLFQRLGDSRLFGFSRTAKNETLFRGAPFAARLPKFGAILTAAELASAASQLTSTDLESVKYGQSAAGAAIGSVAGAYAGSALGALTTNPLVAAIGGISGSLIGGGVGAVAGGNLPVYKGLYDIQRQQQETQGNANALLNGALSPILSRPTGIRALAEPLATALDASFVAGPITDYPKRLAGLPTRGDVQSTLAQLSLDARSGKGFFAGTKYDVAQRFAITAFAQSEGLGGSNQLYRDQGVGGYVTRNSLAESVLGVGNDLYNELKNRHYSNKQIRAIQDEYQASVSALYSKQSKKFEALAKSRQQEADRGFFRDPNKFDPYYDAKPTAKQIETLSKSLGKTYLSAAPAGFFEKLVKTSGGQASVGRGIDNFFGGIGRAISQNFERNSQEVKQRVLTFPNFLKREAGTAEAKKSLEYAKTLGSIASYSQNVYESSRGQEENYAAKYAAMYAARQAQINAEKKFSAGNRLITQKFEEGLSLVTAPSYNDIKFDYRSVNAAVADLTPGDVTPSEYKRSFSQSYRQQLGIFTGNVENAQKDFAQFRDATQAGANAYIKKLRSRSAPSEAGAIDVETAASRIQTDLNRVLIKPSQEIEKLTKNITELSKQMNPATENSFAYFVSQTAKVALSDARYYQSKGVETVVSGYRSSNHQLESDRQLGLISNENFIRKTAANDRAALQQQYSLYQSTLSDYENRVSNEAKTLRESRYNPETGRYDIPDQSLLNRADQVEKSFDFYKAASQQNFDVQFKNLSDEETNRRIQLARQQAFGNDFQPFFSSLFSSAQKGVNPISSLGGQFSGAFSKLGGSATANLLGNNKFIGDIFAPLIGGDVPTLAKNLATRFGSKGAPVPGASGIYLQGFSTPSLAEKSISYGTVGYAASQQLANYLSPYQNQTVGGLGSLAGGLIGSAFGPVGTGIGSALGGLIGAAPFTQNPIGGGLTGAAAGAIAGSFLLPGIGTIAGGLFGGLLGFLGGKESKAKKESDRKAKQLERFNARLQGTNYAKSYLSGGVDYASDLFNGYGSYSDKQSALTNYLSDSTFSDRAGFEIFDSSTLSYAKSAFGNYKSLFLPIQNLADKYQNVISRPGSFQGAIFDVGLQNAQLPIAGGAFSSGPTSDLLSSFSSLQSSLGQYGFDSTRANLAYSVFSGQYQNQLQGLDYEISQSSRDYQSLLQANSLSATGRSLQADITARSLSTFERDSQNSIESAMGTLQRRENRSAIVAQLKDDQAFERDILNRQADLQTATNAYQAQQDQYQSQDALKSLQDLTSSRTILVDAFNQLAPKLTDASSEFYQMSEAIKEVNQQLTLLSRNLR